ncbi:MAG: YbaB/EbfC family nucleoid-associated protein [Pseudonocardia sp.]
MDGHEWLTAYQQRVQDIGARAQRAQTELRHVEVTTTSRDGAVTVTVNPAGALLRLVLDERADRLTRVQLAEAVLATARQAQTLAAREAIEAVAPLLGEPSEAVRVLRAYLPEAGPR